MYLPSAFRQDDLTELHAQMQASPFALLTSAGAAGVLRRDQFDRIVSCINIYTSITIGEFLFHFFLQN